MKEKYFLALLRWTKNEINVGSNHLTKSALRSEQFYVDITKNKAPFVRRLRKKSKIMFLLLCLTLETNYKSAISDLDCSDLYL